MVKADIRSEPDIVFMTIALPNYRDFLLNQKSVRHAYNAAVSIAHMADHIAIRSKPPIKPAKARQDFKQANQCFLIVDEMCTAIKHGIAGGADNVRATATGMHFSDPSAVLFVGVVDSRTMRFHTEKKTLIFDHYSGGKLQQHDVGWSLYGALMFVATKLKCDHVLTTADLPEEVNFLMKPEC